MSLPQKLFYGSKVSASYAKNYTSIIQCQNTNSFNLGQTCTINIPCSRNTVLSGADSLLNIRLRIKNGAAGAFSFVTLNRGGIQSAIQRIRLFANGTLVCDIDNYGNLINLLTPYQMSGDNCVGKNQVLQGTDIKRGANLAFDAANAPLGAGAPLAANVHLPYKDFSFPLLSIMTLTQNYVPLYALQSLRMEIQFVDSIQKFICADQLFVSPTDGNAVFSEVKFIANFVELSDRAMDIIQRSLDGKPVQWSCNTFSNFVSSNTLAASTTTVSIPVPIKVNSLKSLLITMRASDNGGIKLFADDCCFFNLTGYQFRMGSRVVPAEMFGTVPQYLSEFERAIGSVSNKSPCSYSFQMINANTPKANNLAFADMYSQCAAIGLECESYASVPMESLYTGLNTTGDDVYFMPTFAAQAAATVVRFDTYALYDCLVVIDQGNVSVVY